MPYYLNQVTYASEAFGTLIRNPQNRIEEAVRPAIERMGGTLIGSWLAFGDVRRHPPHRVAGQRHGGLICAGRCGGGTVKDIKTTPLLTWEEGVEAMRQAADMAYRLPNG
jgi:hypothetical protein